MKKHWIMGACAAFFVSMVLGCGGGDTTPPPPSEDIDGLEADANTGNAGSNTQPAPAGNAQGF